MLPDFKPLVTLFYWLLFVALPLALWKLIDIVIWIFRHLNVSWN